MRGGKTATEKYLAIIPARGGSKRIPNKNIRKFNGKPLIAYTIEHAEDSGLFDRIIVDTDSPEIREVALKLGAEAPFLRPEHLASDTSKIGDAIKFLLQKLKGEEDYQPQVLTLLQTTSPLREVGDIHLCFQAMQNPQVRSVCTVSETSPWFYNLDRRNRLRLINDGSDRTTNTQEVPKGYFLNGCMVYMIRTPIFLRTKKFVDRHTVAVVTPKWRAVDLDHPEDWVLAEFLHKHKDKIHEKLKNF